MNEIEVLQQYVDAGGWKTNRPLLRWIVRKYFKLVEDRGLMPFGSTEFWKSAAEALSTGHHFIKVAGGLGAALVVGQARLQKSHPKWNTIRNPHATLAKKLGEELMKKAGVNEKVVYKTRDYKKLEAALPGHQIQVFNASREIIYKGSPAEKIIHLLCRDDVYYVITRIELFLNK